MSKLPLPNRIFFQPVSGYVGDVIPFYWQDQFHAFYLQAPPLPRRKGADFTTYAHLVLSDLVHWEEQPAAVSPGPPSAPDAVSCWTGSVIHHNGVFHLFYTGYAGQEDAQTICHATSLDLVVWSKDPANPLFGADTHVYEAHAWRDPFVFWNETTGQYWMLLTARLKGGPKHRRGCIAYAVSNDLQTWQIKQPWWSPNQFDTHECPDYFRWSNHFYILFSEYSDRHETRYRLSASPDGPWCVPEIDSFDGFAFYAAKTASDGRRRFLFGWNSTRVGETDTGEWEWGGSLLVHELNQKSDGTLSVGLVPELESLFTTQVALTPQPILGEWRTDDGIFQGTAPEGYALISLAELPETCLVAVQVECSGGTAACSILLRADEALETYYEFRWEPLRHRFVYDRNPRPGREAFILERALSSVSAEKIELKIVLDGTVMVAYINNQQALSVRGYAHRAGKLGFGVTNGRACLTQTSLMALATEVGTAA